MYGFKILQKIRILIKILLDKKSLYAGGSIQNSFRNHLLKDNLKKEFEILIKNLDQESINIICRIFFRLKKASYLKTNKIFDLTNEEIERLSFIQHSFQPICIQKYHKDSNKGGGYGIFLPFFSPFHTLRWVFFLTIME